MDDSLIAADSSTIGKYSKLQENAYIPWLRLISKEWLIAYLTALAGQNLHKFYVKVPVFRSLIKDSNLSLVTGSLKINP